MEIMERPKEIYSIPLKEIIVSDCNARLTDKKAGIEELADSIKRHGLLQPVVLRGSYGNPLYELIVGQRRFRAHQFIDKKDICAVFAGDLDDIEARILSLGENMQRVELNHADKAKAITGLYLHFHKDLKKLKKELGLSLQTIRDYIELEQRATSKAKKLLKEGKLKKIDVKRAIDAAQGDDRKADKLLGKMADLSKYEKERVVDYGKRHPQASAEEIIEKGPKPKHERTIILNISEETCEAVEKAERALSMDRESIAERALSEWLTRNGFLKQQA
jgi:ParB/RepB/Spo0J family partition protein